MYNLLNQTDNLSFLLHVFSSQAKYYCIYSVVAYVVVV